MQIRRVIASLSLVAAMFFCADANAADVIIKSADVPFDFVVRGQVLPAGKYTIMKTDISRDLLLLRNDRTRQTVSTLSFPEGKTSNISGLVFDIVDGENVLRAVVTRSSYSTVTPMHREKRTAQMSPPETTAGR
jgi:hypothetical protein